MPMIFGVDYYPEHWDRDEWEAQAALMEEAGFNTVRMAEFGWKIMEKKEGEYDFSLFDEAMEILAGHGIKTVLGTPTAAPPKWLADDYDVLQKDKYGRVRQWGSRRECCANSPDYLKKSKAIVEKMAEHYKDNPNVAGWQIDNEFGCHGSARCFCEHCRQAFIQWLKGRYSSIEELNHRWGTAFWSLDYDSFDEIILPAYSSCDSLFGENKNHNPALELEYFRFASASWVNYQKMQIDIIRRYSRAPITHNMMGHFSDIDYGKLAADLDFVSWDNYPDNQWGSSEYEYVSMAHEIMRGVKKKNFVVMEEQAGPAGWDRVGATPRPGQLALWVYQAVAHGAEGIVFFRFRTALFGMEQYWYGVLDHDGVPRRRFYEIQAIGKKLKFLASYIKGAENKKEVLIVKSYDNLWAHDIKCHRQGYNYENHLYSFYKANADLNLNAAVECDFENGFGDYKVVYLPAYNIVRDEELPLLEEYVRGGGTLVLTFQSGTRDVDNEIRPLIVPGVFAELAGVRVPEFDAPRKEVAVVGADAAPVKNVSKEIDVSAMRNFSGTAKLWCDIIEPDGADVLAVYGSEYYKGTAAVTVNPVGAGRVFYVGCDLDGTAMKALAEYIAREAGLTPIKVPDGVEIIKRENAFIVLNHNEEPVQLDISGTTLAGGTFDGKLEGYGAEFLEYKNLHV